VRAISKIPQSAAEVARIEFDPERIKFESASSTFMGSGESALEFTFRRNAKTGIPFPDYTSVQP
jgi:hypothetical protein